MFVLTASATVSTIKDDVNLLVSDSARFLSLDKKCGVGRLKSRIFELIVSTRYLDHPELCLHTNFSCKELLQRN